MNAELQRLRRLAADVTLSPHDRRNLNALLAEFERRSPDATGGVAEALRRVADAGEQRAAGVFGAPALGPEVLRARIYLERPLN